MIVGIYVLPGSCQVYAFALAHTIRLNDKYGLFKLRFFMLLLTGLPLLLSMVLIQSIMMCISIRDIF